MNPTQVLNQPLDPTPPNQQFLVEIQHYQTQNPLVDLKHPHSKLLTQTEQPQSFSEIV